MSYIDRAVMDLIARGQSSRLIPTSGKIYDITHADIVEHSVSLPAGFPFNTKAIFVRPKRVAGTGNFWMRTVQGVLGAYSGSDTSAWWIRAIDGLFYYRLSVINDDWDIFALAYMAG